MIRSSRNVFIGSHVKRPVKDALKKAAERSGISQSEFVSTTLTNSLKESGDLDNLPAESTEQDVPLPLGD